MPDITFAEFISTLPITDPNVTGALWKSGDLIKISGGTPTVFGGSVTEQANYGIPSAIAETKIFTAVSATAPNWVTSTSGASVIADNTDLALSGSTHVLTFADGGNLGNSANHFIEFTCYADVATKQFSIRYFHQGEASFDFFYINVDGIQVHSVAGINSWQVFTIDLSPGAHTIRLRFVSDGSVSGGIQNTRISKIVFPIVNPAAAYVHGDTVLHNSRLWHCIKANTLLEPAFANSADWAPFGSPPPTETMVIAVGDETTVMTTGNAKVTFRMPYAFTVTGVRASLTTASTSGIPTIDVNESGVSMLSTKLTIDANEKTSTTAVISAVISDATLVDDAEITVDIDAAGTGATGLKVYLIGYRTILETSYTNTGGTGNRTSIITMSQSDASMLAGGAIADLINGTFVNTYYWQIATGNGSSWLKFDFGSSKIIDEFKWYQDVANTHGTWRMEGSNDDSTYTQVGFDFTLGIGTFGIPNTTSYRYYRLRHMSGGRTNIPYLREIEFKIST